MRSFIASLMMCVTVFTAAACASDTADEPTAEPSPTQAEAASTGPVKVELGEWAILAEPEDVAAGEITFEVSNGGTDPHELIVIASDKGPGGLPTKADGSVDEEKVDIIGEVEELEAAAGDAVVSEELTVDLDPGRYALVCNLVEEEDGKTEVHYKLGMRSALTVS